MNAYPMIKKLRKAGIAFTAGMDEEEIHRCEAFFGFRFPREIRAFLACAVPVGEEFFDWRDLSEANLQRFRDFQRHIEDTFVFDVEHSEDLLQEFIGDTVARITDRETLKTVVLDWLHRSVRLIPFYAHRCFFDGMDEMPIVSFWQAVDTIFYGSDFENYLENEFLRRTEDWQLGEIPDKMKDAGIWYYLVG